MDKDERFKHLATDPKFRRIPKDERKVKIDKRFQSMFTDKKFKLKYTVDKRGRPINHTTTENLKRYYDLDSDSVDESKSETETEPGKFVCTPKDDEELSSNDLNAKHQDDKNVSNHIKSKLKDLKVDYARGEGVLVTDDSSSDDDDDEEESDELSESEEFQHGWGELDKDSERTEEITNRLAVCNMDWDRIRATDLMVLFHSFLSTSGRIESITIYPSDFGLERMKEEEIKGPTELLNPTIEDSKNENEETEEGSNYHIEKLRQYQLNRLKYYYAIIVCDNPETANKIYTECDGLEYESSATKIDLRFVPNDTEFENEPKEMCNKLPERYEPKLFTTAALQQGKVELTWDETSQERIEIAKKLTNGKVDDVSEMDLQAYLASSSGEESEEEEKVESNENTEHENPIDKYRALLLDLEKKSGQGRKDKDFEMEISWGLDLKDKTQKLVKQKLAEKEEKTPFEQMVEKRKQKQKAKREERKKKFAKDESEEDEDIPSDIDMNDPYFTEEFDKPEFKKKPKNKPQRNEELDEEELKKKANLELLLFNEQEDEKKHFSLKKIQEQENVSKKKKKKFNKKKQNEQQQQQDDFQVDANDERFSALYTSHHFNIDPTDPHYRKTKAMETLIDAKLKRRINSDAENVTDTKKLKTEINSKRNAELNVLVKSVKRKTQALRTKK